MRAGSSIALRMGIKPLVIGLTIIAFGTGSPELVVSIKSALAGNSSIAIGSVVGSNISNTALILGVAALIYPLKAEAQVVRREIPLMILITAILWLLIADGELGRIDGVILLTGSVLYTFLVYFLAQKDKNKHVSEEFEEALDLDGPIDILDAGADSVALISSLLSPPDRIEKNFESFTSKMPAT